ncbi:histidine phosphatase family protein [Lysinibacillus sp. 54212]|uniref:histidine phosphatase family protein n=1 Tax=Lysinibacillus sp. 54212 TaxID=3119829 RepID=UPI002FCBE97E
MKTIYLVRHGETEWNKLGKLQGWLDSELTELGVQQARALQYTFQGMDIDTVYSSDLGRAISTARLIVPAQEPVIDARLKEIFLGEWQGKELQYLERDPCYEQYVCSPQSFQPTTQETFQSVANRMHACLQSVAQKNEKNIIMVSHGIAIHCLLWKLSGERLHSLSDLIPSCGVVKLNYCDGIWEIQEFTLRKVQNTYLQ